ncbi:MAG: complex I subunit 1/NuoH family protein [Candidatus Kariarchaeaceae archaeon]
MSERFPYEDLINDLFESLGPIGDFWKGLGTSGQFFLISGLLMVGVAGLFIMIQQLIVPWVERKVMGRMQSRRGPSYVGYAGTLQLLADTLKLAIKQDIVPEDADKFGFTFAIAGITISASLACAPLPFTGRIVMSDMTIGLLYIFAAFALFPPLMFVAGWASNSKYSLIGGFRSAAQLLAYELPLMVAAVSAVLLAGSANLSDIVNGQGGDLGFLWLRGWYWFPLVIGFGLFLISGLAETERIPFDLPEAESELVMGVRTEFAGWRYALIFFVEYMHLFINLLLVVLLFMGGWMPLFTFMPATLDDFIVSGFVNILIMAIIGASLFGGSVLAVYLLFGFFRKRIYNMKVFLGATALGFVLFGGLGMIIDDWTIPGELLTEFAQLGRIFAKVYFLVFLAVWARAALPRIRIDQFLSIAWSKFLPLSILNLLIAIIVAGAY